MRAWCKKSDSNISGEEMLVYTKPTSPHLYRTLDAPPVFKSKDESGYQTTYAYRHNNAGICVSVLLSVAETYLNKIEEKPLRCQVKDCQIRATFASYI